MQVLKKYSWWVVVTIFAIGSLWWFFNNQNNPALITTAAEIGTVRSFIAVSGTATVDDIIPLSFPKGGTVSGVFVSRGDEVATGTILATVGDTALQADYAASLAETTRLRAVRNELLAGQTAEEATVTDSTVKKAEIALTNTIRTETARVEAARTTLYNTGLTAIATNPDTGATPPTITGSYTCTAEGVYRLELYRSGTLSGYSYRYSGIETGVNNASTNQSNPLGECGLRLQFAADTNYSNAVFTITIPNTASPTFAANQALYEQAKVQEEANINAARQALDLALDQGTLTTAGPRVERLIAANANVAAAEARLTKASFALSESALRAPSTGIVTEIKVTNGQTVSVTPVLTLFTPRKTVFTALIPERDISKISIEQSAELVFDASPEETVLATVSFVSPIQTVVNGVSYYEAELLLQSSPTWLRSGMQADVKIYTETLTDIIRIPRLFLKDNQVLVNTPSGTKVKDIEVLLIGTDGFVAVSGITAGTKLVLPTN